MNRIFNFGKNKNNEHEYLPLVSAANYDVATLFDDFLGSAFGDFNLFKSLRVPAIDIYEKGDKLIVKADLPGIDKKNIKLSLDKDILMISGEVDAKKEEKKKDFYYSERSFGKLERSVKLPEGIKPDDIKAYYKDGVLTIEALRPKVSDSKGKDIVIE